MTGLAEGIAGAFVALALVIVAGLAVAAGVLALVERVRP